MEPGVDGLLSPEHGALLVFWPAGAAALSRDGVCCGKQENRSSLTEETRAENPARGLGLSVPELPFVGWMERVLGRNNLLAKILPRSEQGHTCPSLEVYIYKVIF